MAAVTKKNTVNRLDYNIPIVHADGRPTEEFQRKWLQQASTNAAIPDVTTISGVSAILDLITAAKGSLLTRGITNWQGLPPATGHDGWLLTFNNTSGLPEWRQLLLTGIPAAIWIDGAGVGYMALVDANGQEVLDGSGNAIYITNPTLPEAMLPLGSSSAFGAVKVDNSSIAAVLGIITTKFNGLYLTLSAIHNYTAGGAYQKALYDVITLDSQGAYSAITGKFTPTKAGTYLVFCVGQAQAVTAMTQANMIVSKNGTVGGAGTGVFTVVVGVGASASDSAPMTGLGLVAMNGTTDFLELDFFISGTGGGLALKQASTWGALYVGA